MRATIRACCIVLILSTLLGIQAVAQKSNKASATTEKTSTSTGQQDRVYWSDLLYKIASPVILNLASGTLKKNRPLEKGPNYGLNAEQVTYLEAVGRTMAGIAPWLALPDDETKEGKQRKQLRDALLKGIRNAVDPSNPDYLNFKTEQQPIVDAAFMAHGFLRAKNSSITRFFVSLSSGSHNV